MFFNKLKEELKEENKKNLKDRIAFFAEIYTKDIIKGLKATYKTLEELIAEYKHTKWEELTPFEAEILIDRFNLVPLIGNLAIYKGEKITFADWHYVGDTLKDAYEKELKKLEEKYIPKRRLKECLQEEKIYTPPSKEKVALAKIKAIASNQKSTVKAVKAIKEVLKDVE